jgi:hypothetical protein
MVLHPTQKHTQTGQKALFSPLAEFHSSTTSNSFTAQSLPHLPRKCLQPFLLVIRIHDSSIVIAVRGRIEFTSLLLLSTAAAVTVFTILISPAVTAPPFIKEGVAKSAPVIEGWAKSISLTRLIKPGTEATFLASSSFALVGTSLYADAGPPSALMNLRTLGLRFVRRSMTCSTSPRI